MAAAHSQKVPDQERQIPDQARALGETCTIVNFQAARHYLSTKTSLVDHYLEGCELAFTSGYGKEHVPKVPMRYPTSKTTRQAQRAAHRRAKL